MPRRDRDKRPDSPAVRLLDALRDGDVPGVLAQCGPTTTVTAENMRWSCRGVDEIERWLAEARAAFPGLSFESRVRHEGFGLVIEDARVRDDRSGRGAAETTPTAGHRREGPSYDGPGATPEGLGPPADGTSRAVAVWRERGDDADGPPPPLDMPVRVTVKHDDLQVHEIALSFPAALLKRALGRHVDPLEMSLSEVQSAFIAPAGGEFVTHTLTRPELTLAPPPVAHPAPEPVTDEPPRRRRRGLVPLLLVLLVALGGGGWYVLRGNDTRAGVAAPATQSHQPKPTASQPTPSKAPTPSSSPSSSKAPVIRHSASATPTRKPNVTLKSDLAFGFNSATLSTAARSAIARLARQVRAAGLTGTIFIDGYTDSLGSAAYGKVLSQKRADAVAQVLRSRLTGVPVTLVALGHGESHPIASNATAAGRQKNRRVTITLPKA